MNKKSWKKDVTSWDKYWGGRGWKSRRYLYDLVASFYRRCLLKPHLNKFIKKYFKKDAKLLHAGCGGGEVDMDIQKYADITAVDFSDKALRKYRLNHGNKCKIVKGDIRRLNFNRSSFDGIYNLGVFEHFSREDVSLVLKQFHKVLKPKGKIVIFWPPEYGISVFFFKTLVFVIRDIFNIRNVEFHPPEVFRLRSKAEVSKLFKENGFKIIKYYFGWGDLFTNIAIVSVKI